MNIILKKYRVIALFVLVITTSSFAFVAVSPVQADDHLSKTVYAEIDESNTFQVLIQLLIKLINQRLEEQGKSQVDSSLFAELQDGDEDDLEFNTQEDVPAICNYRNQELAVGGSGKAVQALQEYLQDAGYFKQEPTAYFGSVTRNALAAFQQGAGIFEAADSVGSTGFVTRAYFSNMCRGIIARNQGLTPSPTGTSGPQCPAVPVITSCPAGQQLISGGTYTNGCSVGERCVALPSAASTTSATGTIIFTDPTGNCPVYEIQTCGIGKKLVYRQDRDECSIPHCVTISTNPRVSCPVYETPTCGDDENITFGRDRKGCAMPICVAKPVPDNCPVVEQVTCSVGEVVRTETDQSGCSVSRCVPGPVSFPDQCPIYQLAPCGVDEKHITETRPDGCGIPKCVPITDITPINQCPLYLLAPCAANEELSHFVNSEGCSVPQCVPKEITSI